MPPEQVKSYLKEQKEKVIQGLKIINGIKVRLISEEDINDLKRSHLLLPRNLSDLISPRMFVLEKNVKIKEGEMFDYCTEMQNIILSLRLLKSGALFGSFVFCILVAEKRQLDGWSEDYYPNTRLGAQQYFLEIKELPQVRKIIRKIASVDFSRRKSLDLACRRFQRAYEEQDEEDQLIDLMIAFEALFLQGEKRISAKGRTMAIACSTLLGKDKKERDKIKRTLLEAYSIRNSIVHGSEVRRFESDAKEDLQFDTLPDLVSDVEDYLRESIKKLLD